MKKLIFLLVTILFINVAAHAQTAPTTAAAKAATQSANVDKSPTQQSAATASATASSTTSAKASCSKGTCKKGGSCCHKTASADKSGDQSMAAADKKAGSVNSKGATTPK